MVRPGDPTDHPGAVGTVLPRHADRPRTAPAPSSAGPAGGLVYQAAPHVCRCPRPGPPRTLGRTGFLAVPANDGRDRNPTLPLEPPDRRPGLCRVNGQSLAQLALLYTSPLACQEASAHRSLTGFGVSVPTPRGAGRSNSGTVPSHCAIDSRSLPWDATLALSAPGPSWPV